MVSTEDEYDEDVTLEGLHYIYNRKYNLIIVNYYLKYSYWNCE